MSVFAYDPEGVKSWANSVVNYLNGDADSVNSCSKRFGEQIEKLVQPNVWTGAAAAQNYQNFLDTHKALIDFINSFGTSFQEAMNSVNSIVNELETSNLGVNTNVSSDFGTLSYSQLAALSQENINQAVVRYDAATIASIGTALNTILTDLGDINGRLSSKINELNNGNGIWDGDSAEKSRESLINTLETNMNAVIENLNVCIKNISTAAENATGI